MVSRMMHNGTGDMDGMMDGMMGGAGTAMYLGSVLLSLVNAVLLLALLSIYLKGYKELKAKFTLGLVVFALLLLVQNLSALILMALFYGSPMGMMMGVGGMGFFPALLQTVALAVLLFISRD